MTGNQSNNEMSERKGLNCLVSSYWQQSFQNHTCDVSLHFSPEIIFILPPLQSRVARHGTHPSHTHTHTHIKVLLNSSCPRVCVRASVSHSACFQPTGINSDSFEKTPVSLVVVHKGKNHFLTTFFSGKLIFAYFRDLTACLAGDSWHWLKAIWLANQIPALLTVSLISFR